MAITAEIHGIGTIRGKAPVKSWRDVAGRKHSFECRPEIRQLAFSDLICPAPGAANPVVRIADHVFDFRVGSLAPNDTSAYTIRQILSRNGQAILGARARRCSLLSRTGSGTARDPQ